MMTLRFNALLVIFLLAGVCADFCLGRYETTGPTNPATGAVLPRVGKNTTATYNATASYNGKPVLHAEEKVTKEKWTYIVTHGPGAAGNPTETGTGNSVVFSKKSVYPGTYVINVMFKIIFTIETPLKDAGQYVYVNGKQQFTKREDPYSGIGSATLNVKNGKFEVKIKPDDNFPLFNGDTNGYRNKLGIGEVITICVFPEGGSNDTVVFDHVMFNRIRLPQTVSVGEFSRTIDFDVFAMVNGTLEGPESIGLTVVDPNGVIITKEKGSKYHILNVPSVGFWGYVSILPSDVSFAGKVSFYEGPSDANGSGLFMGMRTRHNPGNVSLITAKGIDPVTKKTNTAVNGLKDKISFTWQTSLQPPFSFRGHNSGTFTCPIPCNFKIAGRSAVRFCTLDQTFYMDTNGNTTVTKGGASEDAKYGDGSSTPPGW